MAILDQIVFQTIKVLTKLSDYPKQKQRVLLDYFEYLNVISGAYLAEHKNKRKRSADAK